MNSSNPYAAPKVDEQPIPEQPLAHYVPLVTRSKWVAATIAASLVSGTLFVIVPSSGDAIVQDGGIGGAMTTGAVVEIVNVVCGLAAMVMVGFFLPQANRNARVLAEGIRFSPGSTVWWFFIPFLNFVRPYQATAELWNSSEPLTTVRWKFGKTPAILRIWWGAWIVSMVFGVFESRTGATQGVVSLLCDFVAGVSFILIVGGVAARQEQRKKALEAVGALPSTFAVPSSG
jgi:Domain of unknown function (DUF4328)